MIRTGATRVLGSSRGTCRNVSTSSTLFVKIRHPDGSTTSASPPPQPKQHSPAERPPPPLSNDSGPSQPHETVVNEPASGVPPHPTNAGATESTKSEQDLPSTPPPTSTPHSTPDPIVTDKIDLSSLPSLDIETDARRISEPSPDDKGPGGKRRTGAGRKEYVSSIERQRRTMLRFGLGAVVLGGLGAAWYAGLEDEKDGQGGGAAGHWQRIKTNMSETFDIFNKPAFKVLLPDPLPAPHQRPYTLLVDLEGLLVSSSWDRQSGWKTAKRPGVDYFLAYLSQFYEIVLFTSQPLYTAAPVAEKLDPFQAYLPYKLFRESTRSVGGKVVKDLTYLNRDLSKTILLDTVAEHAALQPDNAIIIKPWERKGGDQGLVDLIPFLESIAIYNASDVRPILLKYQGKDIPTEYAKKETEQKKITVEEWERKHPTSMHGAGSGILTSIFGSVATPGQSRLNQPMTYLEQRRAQAQKNYQEEQKYWADNAENFKKLIEEDKQKQLAEMKGSLMGYFAGPGGGAPKPEERK